MNQELNHHSPDGLIHPACQAIMLNIAAARTAKDLHRIAKEEIASNQVSDEALRLKLWDAVSRRFSALNAEALRDKPGPRWG